jgi:hypothetical protein
MHLPSSRAIRHSLCHFALAAALPLGALRAQTATGAGDDAIPVNKGQVRLRIAGLWNDWDQVYDSRGGRGEKRGLLAGVNGLPLGAATLPQLQAPEAAMRTLTGNTAFTLSLGTLEARGDVRQSIAPINVDVGVTRRVSVGLLVPYVESRDNALLVLNRTGNGATVGANPAFSTTGGAAARNANGAVLRQIAQARAQLAAEIARCTSASATGCDAIRANVPAAQALLQRALTTQGALAGVYGDSVRGGSPVVPFASSLVGESIAGNLSALRTAFEGFGITSLGGVAPVGATTAYGPGGITAIAADSAFGLAYTTVGNRRRAGVGDIDLTASVLLFDTFGGSQRARLTNTGRALRSLVQVGWRFGTAGADDAADPFDVPIGDGANALLLRSTTDVVFNRRAWLSATVRAVKPFSDQVAVPIPLRTDSTLFGSFTVGSAQRSLGSRIELELAPRLALGDFFGVSAAYLYRRQGSDALRVSDEGIGAAPLLLATDTGTRTAQAAAFGVSFSTLASYVRGRSRLPLEVTYTHSNIFSASGGVVPATATDRLELRVYTGFSRR